MKFMKLGSRPDTFYSTEAVRSVSSDISSDLIVQINGSSYLLHKFPLLSKSVFLQRLCSESPDSPIHLPDFPGGIDAFELCAKFCYGIAITLSAYNIVAARCAAEYLQMTEDVEKGNLIYKLEVFFSSCILHGWRDCIVTLQTTKAYPLWAEDLGITGRCVEAIVAKILKNPSKVSLSHSHSRRGSVGSYNGAESRWWAEDMAELRIDLYWRAMIAVKSGGRVPSSVIGEALRIYASRWLPEISRSIGTDSDCKEEKGAAKHRVLLESIITLLPAEKGAVSCRFLLQLLKAANLLGASSGSKTELARRVGLQLEDASPADLLIPSPSSSPETIYDVDITMTILDQFLLQAQSPPTSPTRSKLGRRRSRSAENIDMEFQERRRSSSASHSSKLKVAKIVDTYLQEIGREVNLPLSKFIAIADAVPDFARLDHDDLYRAIDIYLRAHGDLNKSERKRLCRILDCKKLSMEACIHAAKNELLPLRVVVQVLFSDQARATTSDDKMTDLPPNIKALLVAQGIASSRSIEPLKTMVEPKLNLSTQRMKLTEDEDVVMRDPRATSFCAIPVRPKKMLSKLCSINRSGCKKHNKLQN